MVEPYLSTRFAELSKTVEFAAGEQSKVVTFEMLNNYSLDPSWLFNVTMSDPVGMTIGDQSTASVRVDDNDSSYYVTMPEFAANEGRPFDYYVSRTGPTSATQTVYYHVEGIGENPASASDFVGGVFPQGGITFLPGESFKIVSLISEQDSIPEASEGFIIRLHDVYYMGGVGGQIGNDDVSFHAVAAQPLAFEGDSGTTPVEVMIYRNGWIPSGSTLTWAVVPKTANASDFADGVLPSGSVYLSTDGAATVTLSIAGDTLAEADETFEVRFRDGSGAVVASVALTIRNDDTVAGSSNEWIKGSASADTLDGGAGNDTILGFAGDDSLSGGADNDSVSGGSGNDTVTGDVGRDTLDGGDGVDTVDYSGLGAVTVNLTTGQSSGAAGSDKLSGFENIIGGAGNDRLTGDAGANLLSGGGGNDLLDGGPGGGPDGPSPFGDTLRGGSGNDTYVVHLGNQVWGGELIDETDGLGGDAGGIDQVNAYGNYFMAEEIENLTLIGANAYVGWGNVKANRISITGNDQHEVYAGMGNDTVSGGGGGDMLRGDDGNDQLWGNGGNDFLIGMSGNDAIDGGTGDDVMAGGKGADTYAVDSAGDVVTEVDFDTGAPDSGGVDLVKASVSYTLAEYIEKLTLTGSSSIDGAGNALANTLTGNAGDNGIDGLGGDDQISGGAGMDNLSGGEGNDRLDGGAGADIMIGGSGNDSYTVDNWADAVIEIDGSGDTGGTDTVTASVSFTLGQFIETLTLTGSSAIDGTGNDLANRISGNAGANLFLGGAGNDTISGGAGNDTLSGGLGADVLSGGAGRDTFRFDAAPASGIDRIADFNVADDTITLDRTIFTQVSADVSGALMASQFVVGTAAVSADQRVIYNAAKGILLYDADGNGAGAAEQVATLGAKLAMTAADFQVI